MTSLLLTYLHPLTTNAANGPRCKKSAANTQPLDQRLVTRLVGTGEIIEQLATLGYELEQSTPGMIVLDVTLEVLGQIVDAFRKNGHLHLRRSSVAGLGRIGLDDFRLAGACDRHRVFLFCMSEFSLDCHGCGLARMSSSAVAIMLLRGP